MNENAQKILKERLEYLNKENETLNHDEKYVESILDSLKDISIHPRQKSLIPLNDRLYINASLHTSEYLIKFENYKVLASHSQAIDYIDKIIENFEKKIEDCQKEKQQIEERLKILSDLADNNSVKVEGNAVVINRVEGVEIIEYENVEYVKPERVAKVQNDREREEYLKSLAAGN